MSLSCGELLGHDLEDPEGHRIENRWIIIIMIIIIIIIIIIVIIILIIIIIIIIIVIIIVIIIIIIIIIHIPKLLNSDWLNTSATFT